MATIRLIPSAYTSSNSSYATVYSGESNMYDNTDDTSDYASLRGRNRNSTTAYYIFLRGFNFGDVPANANVTSFEVKIRCYRNSYQRTGDNYRLRLSSSTNINNVIANSITSTEIGTTQSVITIPTGNITWNTLKGYGSDFSIVIPLSSTSSSRPYIYVYGAEINVTYTQSGGSNKIFVKENNTWQEYSKVWLKVNGTWVEQDSSTWSSLFDTNTNYRKMN